jgi:hypothetical protein
MRKHSVLLSVLMVLMATTVLVAGSAEAGTKVIHFQAISTHCALVHPPSEVWVDEKGILHLRDQAILDVVESDSEYLRGTTIAEIDLDMDLATGNGQVWVIPTHHPADFPEGTTWVAPGQGPMTPAGVMITHHGYGTGDFEGWTIVYTARKIEYPGDPPCDHPLGDAPFAELTGIIIKDD